MTQLNDRQVRFCEEYLIDYNGTQAAIRAGYSKKTARVQASDLLTKPDIQAYLNKKQQKIAAKLEISQERVMEELATIGFSKVTDFLEVREVEVRKKVNGKMQMVKVPFVKIFNTEDIPADKMTAIAGIKQGAEGIEIKLHDKLKALQLIGQKLGMFKDAQTPIELNVTVE